MFFLNFAFGFGISVKFCIFRYPFWPIWRKKFSALFFYILCSLYSFTLWFCLGGGDTVHTCVEMLGRRGGANFLLKCHALYPICLTFLVVHFFTHIYYILNLWSSYTQEAKQSKMVYFLYEFCIVLRIFQNKNFPFFASKWLFHFNVKTPTLTVSFFTHQQFFCSVSVQKTSKIFTG